ITGAGVFIQWQSRQRSREERMAWKHTRREFLRNSTAAGIAAAALGSGLPLDRPARAAELEGPVNILSWGSRNFSMQIDDFLKDTGVHVNFVGASGNSENLAKIKLGGGDQYDIVGVDALWVPKFYQE